MHAVVGERKLQSWSWYERGGGGLIIRSGKTGRPSIILGQTHSLTLTVNSKMNYLAIRSMTANEVESGDGRCCYSSPVERDFGDVIPHFHSRYTIFSAAQRMDCMNEVPTSTSLREKLRD